MENSIKTRLAESKRIIGLAKLTICIAVILSLAFTANVSAVPTLLVTLTGDTVAGGSALGSSGTFTTSEGDISFVGEFLSTIADFEFYTAGARDNNFDIDNIAKSARLTFDFDVCSLKFVFGGNEGEINIIAYGADGTTVIDSFYQGDTDGGAFAGPKTLSGAGIRSLYWEDQKSSTAYAPLDNIEVWVDNVIPAPSALILSGIGVGLVSRLRKRRII